MVRQMQQAVINRVHAVHRTDLKLFVILLAAFVLGSGLIVALN